MSKARSAQRRRVAVRPSPASSTWSTWGRQWPWFLPAILAAVLVYSNTVAGAFVYDDLRQIARNSLIQQDSEFWRALTSDVWAFKGGGVVAASNYWRPTFVFWLIANYRLFGLDPVGWHVTSLILHAFVTGLAYALVRRLTVPRPVAAAIALVFAVHPVHTESVAWISGSPDLLLGAALLGAMHAVLNLVERSSTGRWLAALALYAVALGAKEVAIVLPALVVLLVWRPATDGQPESSSLRRAARLALPFAGLAVVYLGLRLAVLGQFSRSAEAAVGTVAAVLSAPEVFLFYLRQIVWPWELGPSYPLRAVSPDHLTVGNFFLPLLASLGVVAGGCLLAWRSALTRIGLGLFLLVLAPALNLSAFIPEQIVHDRYLYVPLLGFLMLVAAAIDALRRFIPAPPELVTNAAAVALAMCAAPLAVQTWAYNRAWTSEPALWQRAVAVDPTSSFNWAQYAAVLVETGELKEAIAASDRALAIGPSAIARLNRGRALIETGRFDEAERDLGSLVETPDDQINAYTLYQGYEGLAICYERRAMRDQALASLDDARRRLPIYRAALTENVAVLLYQSGRKSEALRELESVRSLAAVELLPESRIVFLRLGMLYAELQRLADARAALGQYLSLTEDLQDKTTVEGRAQATALLGQLGR